MNRECLEAVYGALLVFDHAVAAELLRRGHRVEALWGMRPRGHWVPVRILVDAGGRGARLAWISGGELWDHENREFRLGCP